jgi:D-erythro-7,8-dihydroneopterin triphosphate epimerase
MATIRITNLKLRTIIGINEWERDTKQDVVINVSLEFDATSAAKSDDIKDTVDYKAITKKIIKLVEESEFFLLETLADRIMAIALGDPKVQEAAVRVDKPQALRFSDSVSVELHRQRNKK